MQVWSTSVLFDVPCTSAEDVEEALVGMFTLDDTEELTSVATGGL